MARIDSLVPGQAVTLRVAPTSCNEGYDLDATFLGIKGEGDDRKAVFGDSPADPDFMAYRFQGRWVIGSGAQRISLVS